MRKKEETIQYARAHTHTHHMFGIELGTASPFCGLTISCFKGEAFLVPRSDSFCHCQALRRFDFFAWPSVGERGVALLGVHRCPLRPLHYSGPLFCVVQRRGEGGFGGWIKTNPPRATLAHWLTESPSSKRIAASF